MKYKSTIEVKPDQMQKIIKEYFEKQGKKVEDVKFDVSLKLHRDDEGGYTKPTLNKCDVVVYIEDQDVS
jgi:hypothetical protein